MIQGKQEQANNSIIEKYCYDNDTANCTAYGGLYQWAEAVQYKNGATNTTSPNPPFTGNIQGICPNGWNIPTIAELYDVLSASVKNSRDALLAIGQIWGATNSSGFSALLIGDRYFGDGNFYNLASNTIFWSSTEDNFSSYAYIMGMVGNRSDVILERDEKTFGFSVRCLKDN